MLSVKQLLESYFRGIVDKEHLGYRAGVETAILALSKPQRVKLIQWCNGWLRTDESAGFEEAATKVLQLAEHNLKK